MKVSRSDLILYAIASLSAVIVVVLVYTYIEKRVADAQKDIPVKTITVVEKPELTPVLIANRDLYRGEKIEAGDVRTLMVAKEGVLLKDVFDQPQQALGQFVRNDIYAGEWLFAKKFSDSNQPDAMVKEGVEALIEPGMRAMRIPVSPVSGLLGIISPGDYVDVMSVFKSANGDRVISRVILQNIEVLSIGQESRFKPKTMVQKIEQSGTKQDESVVKQSVVALHVNLQQAESIALAMNVGSVQLLLRSKADSEIKESDGVNVRVIESLKDKPQTRTAKPQRQTVELLQGGAVEEVKVP